MTARELAEELMKHPDLPVVGYDLKKRNYFLWEDLDLNPLPIVPISNPNPNSNQKRFQLDVDSLIGEKVTSKDSQMVICI